MATRLLTYLQTGHYDGAAWLTTATPGLGSGLGVDAWTQLDVTPMVVDVPSGLAVVLTPIDFTEAGTLSILLHNGAGPLLDDFSTAAPPAAAIVATQSLSFTLGISANIVIPLYNAGGQATALGARLRAAWRRDSLGRYRGALGFRWSGVGGSISFGAATLTFTADFGGDSRLWASPNTDRAVECPRCGVPCLESNLIRDGVLTGLYVCSSCYDPPKEPDTFRFPFRRG